MPSPTRWCWQSRRRSTPGADDDRSACVLIDAEGHKAFSAGGDLQYMYDTASKGNFDAGRPSGMTNTGSMPRLPLFPNRILHSAGLRHGWRRRRVAAWLAPGGGRELANRHARMRGRAGARCRRNADFGAGAGSAGRVSRRDRLPDEPSDAILPVLPIFSFRKPVAGADRSADRDRRLVAVAPLRGIRKTVLSWPYGLMWIAHFGADTLRNIVASLPDDDWGQATALKAIRGGSPLSTNCTVGARAAGTQSDDIRRRRCNRNTALPRAVHLRGDFVEGIRAAIIDKDRNPRWRHASIEDVTAADGGGDAV
jgi:enoyl-CoA hydratase